MYNNFISNYGQKRVRGIVANELNYDNILSEFELNHPILRSLLG